MKLLIITQKVDRTDPILGFFHRWIEEFAKNCEQVTVIGQLVGEHDLPENVEIFSMRKERKYSRIMQIFEFWKMQRKLKKEYDSVLVHMTPVWVVIGWPVWFLLRKKIYLWYEARGGGWSLPVALIMVRKVFSASQHGLPRKSKKRRIVGHGIDTELFKPSGEREKGLVVTVGRTTKAKRMNIVLKAFSSLPEHCRLVIAGGPITKEDNQTIDDLRKLMSELGITDRVVIEPKSQQEIASLYARAEISLHASDTGLDKCVLEAMACGCPVVSYAEASKYVLSEDLLCTDESMGKVAIGVLGMSDKERGRLGEKLRQKVVEEHSLGRLVGKLVVEMG
ncbi:glycosyltransferase family 4 protein [Patescibacteria group bacterium]|nr:glycosyltransferase family 4 protein [Patescibacteria group bacterium]MBU1124155.1 glycosyltransferase family 4 protein [Patescibacteria group bacterium]MBU1911471.1 glycosyltransferase family 4 protein [Patescibacteria group bacterium]